MSDVKWTVEQLDAIYEKDSNILVAAAAGSGKTAVLVERIINKVINEHIDIDKLLVVTFTNAAASEMRERVLNAIYKKLDKESENENLQRQITLLNKTSICTIDSFCLDIVRNNFYELEGISPNFRIADTTEIEILKEELIEEIFEKKYEEHDEDFSKLITTYTSYRDDTPLKELVLKINRYIQSFPYPQKWLNEKIEMYNIQNVELDFSNTEWGKIILEDIEEDLIDTIVSLKKAEKILSYDYELERWLRVIQNDIEMYTILKNNINSWDKSYALWKNIELIDWPKNKAKSESGEELKKEAHKIRNDVNDKIKKKLNKLLIYSSKEANEDLCEMHKILIKLEKLILEFDEAFLKAKRDRNMVDFADIEHLALQILLREEEEKFIKTEVAKKYEEKFSEVMIDEYQDSNLVQEFILSSVSNGKNMFMVGDGKQSIYKFRQALPEELFLKKYKIFKKKELKNLNENLKIQLYMNFRSRDNVLDFINMIFENIMSTTLGDIDYNEEEYLNFGAKEYKPSEEDLRTEINIIDLTKNEEEQLDTKNIEIDGEERIENIELEARYVANKIKRLVEGNFQIYDKNEKKLRNIKYKDIVVLLRATKTPAPVFEQEMINLNIPVFSDSSSEYLESIEIQTIINLLKVIDNPIQDIPLVSVLRSNIGKFSDDDLIEIRLSDKYCDFYSCMKKSIVNVNKELKEKIQIFLGQLEQWRKEQEYLALDEFIWKIYQDTGYYNYVGLMPNGILRQANLRMLFERAKKYETSNFKGLYNFINFIDKLYLSTKDMSSAKVIGENDDVVRIMSIHKSKGLEFPVVFLANASKNFNFKDLKEDIMLHQTLGIGAKYIDYERQVQYDTLSKQAIKNKIKNEILAEEMRMLYVALTRAKEKLIITGVERDYEKSLIKMKEEIGKYEKSQNKISPVLIKKYTNYLDWIKLVYLYENLNSNIDNTIQLNVLKKEEVISSFIKEDKKTRNILDVLNENEISKEKLEEISSIVKFEYQYKGEDNIPTKTSVTNMKKAINNMLDENKVEFQKPKFLKVEQEEITATRKGSLMHLCLERLDEKEEYTLEKIINLIDNLVQMEIITNQEAQNINIYKILSFTKSSIWLDLKSAMSVYREKPFYIDVSSNTFVENTDEKVLVQGIIDLFYIDKEGKLVLVDYKTDYIKNENELVEKYKIQLDLYKEALESSMQKKVDRVYIYSTCLEKCIKI